MKAQIQVVFYSMYGHIHLMAEAVAEGARKVDGAEVSLWRVPELVPEDKLRAAGAGEAQAAISRLPIITPQQLHSFRRVLFRSNWRKRTPSFLARRPASVT